MKVCICEKLTAENYEKLIIIDMEKLKKIANSNHKEKENAKQWVNTITSIFNESKINESLQTEENYESPDDFAPEDAVITEFPVTINFICDVWVGDK